MDSFGKHGGLVKSCFSINLRYAAMQQKIALSLNRNKKIFLTNPVVMS
jgi:hypothetical protein